jgi:hypothetical protein
MWRRENWSMPELGELFGNMSGHPTRLVMRRLGHWAMMPSAFPDGAFTDSAGMPMDRLAVYNAAQAFVFEGPASISADQVYLELPAIIAGCKGMDTKLPHGVGSRWDWPGGTHSAPPECPEGELLAALATLQWALEVVQGRVALSTGWPAARFRPDDSRWKWLEAIWSKARARAAELLDKYPDYAVRLDALDAEWRAMNERREQHQGRSVPPPDSAGAAAPPAPTQSNQLLGSGAGRSPETAVEGRGAKQTKRREVIKRMEQHIESGRFTKEALGKMQQEALATEYGASRETVVKARKEVLRRLSGNVGNSEC